MAKAKKPAPIDTKPGTKAHALAVQYKADIDPRVPAGTVSNLAADLTTLGANPNPPPPPTSSTPIPTLAQALTTAMSLITAIHAAVLGAKPKPAVRKAYGASSKAIAMETAALEAAGKKIIERMKAEPDEALALGILQTDGDALVQALSDLEAAETAATGTPTAVPAKERHAAVARMHEAVARIAGAGMLAFALNPAVRAEFETLTAK